MNKTIEIINNLKHNYIISDGKLLTSKFGMGSEEKRLLLKISKNANHTIFIMGIGIGRYVRNILNSAKKFNHIIIYEPSQEIYNNFKTSRYYIEDDSIDYICGDIDIFEKKISNKGISFRHLTIASYGNYEEVFCKEYLEMLKILKNKSSISLTNEVTIQHHSRKFTENLILNIVNGKFNDNINDYKNYFEKIPALIMSAGPSLDKNYDLIKDFKGIIFSGGRTLKLLKRDHIENVMFVSVDPSEKAYSLVSDVFNEEFRYPFFTFFESTHNIIKHYSGPKIIMQSYFTDLYNSGIIKSEVGHMSTGGSVANASVAIADYLGCDPIVFVGQDLAFTDNKHHSDSTMQSFDFDVNNENLTEVDGYYDEKVTTSRNLLGFLDWFNEKIAISDKDYINCTEGGVKIAGTNQLPFVEYIQNQLDITDKRYDDFVEKLESSSLELIEKEFDDILENVIAVRKIVKKALLASLDLKNKSLGTNKINKVLDKLNNYDDEIKKYSKLNSLLNFITSNVLITFKNRKIGKDESVASNNYKFYEDLYEEVKVVEEIIGGVYGE